MEVICITLSYLKKIPVTDKDIFLNKGPKREFKTFLFPPPKLVIVSLQHPPPLTIPPLNKYLRPISPNRSHMVHYNSINHLTRGVPQNIPICPHHFLRCLHMFAGGHL